jgi:L-cysteine/cystine lyase
LTSDLESKLDWESIRSQFPVVEKHTYLNTGTYGPLPSDSLRVVSEIARLEVETGRAGGDYFGRIDNTRNSIARRLSTLLGANTEDIVLTNATTHGCQVVSTGLRLGLGDEIVTTDTEHHSFTTVLRATRADLKIAAVRDTTQDDELVSRVAAQISAKTRLIALSHVSWIDGRVLPLKKIAELGLPVLVDGAQSVGSIPIDVHELGCHFIVFPCQKWLLGPDATGGIYVHPDWHNKLDIAMPSYYGHEPFSGATVDTPLNGAARFSPGSIALAALAPLDASLALAENIGVARFERAARLSQYFRDALQERFEVATAPAQSSLISFDPGCNAEVMVKKLESDGIIVRTVSPDNWLRVSVGFWSNEADCAALLKAFD